MNPLTNAVLGVLFIGVGAGATILMYYLRGSTVRPESRAEAPPTTPDVAGEEEAEYLAAWSRPADDVERQMADIHKMAKTGHSIIEPMRTRKKTVSWDDLLFKGAQLARVPLNEGEPVRTETVIGPAARHPLVIDAPIYVSHMSFGALSREIKIALATGSAAVGTAICSGEGGILEDEFQAAHKYIFEYVPNQYSMTDENLARVDAIEIKIGQSAKPGMGGHLPGVKVTRDIARVRGRNEGVDIISAARFEDIRTREDLKRKVDWLRQRSDGKPIGVKIAAGNIEADLECALFAGPDFITLDGRAGATGAAPKVVKDATSIPTIFALARARKFLTEQNAENVSLVITGGLRVSSDFAKALALGADAVALATTALMAAGCQQYRICNTGRCPVGITSQDPQLRQRLKIEASAKRLENFLRVSIEELKTFARLTANDDVHKLSVSDICTTNSEISNHTGIEHV
ncbi:MAG: FMN-binding glutamate synthase family protein [Planctomycetes bacterium]|nr:FMN-binding glutamate synthase family protein [Planctomycetota bacterium]